MSTSAGRVDLDAAGLEICRRLEKAKLPLINRAQLEVIAAELACYVREAPAEWAPTEHLIHELTMRSQAIMVYMETFDPDGKTVSQISFKGRSEHLYGAMKLHVMPCIRERFRESLPPGQASPPPPPPPQTL